MNLRKTAAVILAAIALAGCASQPKEGSAKLTVKKIAILPVQELTTVSLENKNSTMFLVPIASTAFYLDSKSKQKVFSERFLAQPLTLGSDLTSVLAQALEKKGIQAVVLKDVPRPADDPENIDYANIKTDADAVLHVYFDDVGVFSGLASPDYLPRVNIQIRLLSAKSDVEIYDETLCYGVDARTGNTWAIAADPKFAYPSFDDLMMKLPDVAKAFEAGMQAIGERAATEIERHTK